MANIGKVSKAIYGGIAAAVTTFIVPSASGATTPLWVQILSAIGAGIVGYTAVYKAPKNTE